MCFTNILLQIFCSYGAWLKFKKSTNILLLWSMVGIRKIYVYKYFAPMEHGWNSKIYVYKYSAPTVLHWDSKIYKHFALTELGFFYIFSIILDCFCFAQLRRSLTFVSKIITTFKACRRYAIFVILNTHKIDFPHM